MLQLVLLKMKLTSTIYCNVLELQCLVALVTSCAILLLWTIAITVQIAAGKQQQQQQQ